MRAEEDLRAQEALLAHLYCEGLACTSDFVLGQNYGNVLPGFLPLSTTRGSHLESWANNKNNGLHSPPHSSVSARSPLQPGTCVSTLLGLLCAEVALELAAESQRQTQPLPQPLLLYGPWHKQSK